MFSNEGNGIESFRRVLKLEFRSASIYTISTFITQFGSFLVVPFFWQKLSIVDYGIIAIVDVIGSFLGMFLGLQLDLSITRFYFDWPEQERKDRVGTLWIASWVSTFILGSISLYIFSLVSGSLFSDIPFYPFIFLGLISSIINKLSAVPFATIRIINRPMLYAFYSIVSFIIQVSLNILFVLILNQNLNGYFISSIIANMIIGIMGAIIMMRFAKISFNRAWVREPLKFSVPQIPASTIAGLTTLMDRFLLQKYASLETVGVYSLSLKFTSLVTQLHSALKISFVPFMFKTISQDGISGIPKLTKMRLFYLLPLMIFGLAISVYIKDFVLWINKPEYFPIIKWVPWLIGPTLLMSFLFYLAPGMLLAKKTNFTWIPVAIQLVLVVIGGLLLIPSSQIIGLVIIKYISSILLLLVTYMLSQKYYPIQDNWTKFYMICALLIICIFASVIIQINSMFISFIFHTALMIFYIVSSISVIIGFKKTFTSLISLTSNKSRLLK